MQASWPILLTLAACLCCTAGLGTDDLLETQTAAHPQTPGPASQTSVIKAYGDHRIRIERICNPAHCTTRAYLETLGGDASRRVTGSVEITELSARRRSFVKDVEIVRLSGAYAFDLLAVDTAGMEGSFTLRVIPGDGTTYEAQFGDDTSIAEPE